MTFEYFPDYISLTDMANGKEGEARAADIIKNWIRNRSTIEYLGVWEQLNNLTDFDWKLDALLPVSSIALASISSLKQSM